VPPKTKRTTQHTVGVDDELWGDCLLIAGARRETLSQVVRAGLVGYRAENRPLLDEIKAKQPDDAAPDTHASG
jgi:hypothetical protein